MEKNVKTSKDDVPCLCSQRWILGYMGMIYLIVVSALRMNFSIGILCMVDDENSTFSTSTLHPTSESETEMALINKSNIDTTVYDKDLTYAEFDWSRSVRSFLLASFYYGYLFTQIPGGWLADRFGGRRVLGYTMFIAAILTLILPICARTSVILVFVIRVVLGFAFGMSFPALQSLWGRWAPPLERSKLLSISFTGMPIGTVLTLSTVGLLCEYDLQNGWTYIFYVTGGPALLLVVLWFYMTADTPRQHPRITHIEQNYIEGTVEYDTVKTTNKVPWLSIFKSKAVWASLTAHMCSNWTEYTLLTSLPIFMKEVLKYDLTTNGVLSAVPYVCQGISGIIAGHSADFVRARGFLNTTKTRKVYQIVSFLGAGAFLVATGFMSEDQRYLAIVLLSVAVTFTGLSRAGFDVNPIDYAPKFAGIVYGISNTASTIPGMIAPIVAGILTPNKTPEEWRNVFYLCAGFDIFGTLIYFQFGSGELENWSKDEVTITVKSDELQAFTSGNSKMEKHINKLHRTNSNQEENTLIDSDL